MEDPEINKKRLMAQMVYRYSQAWTYAHLKNNQVAEYAQSLYNLPLELVEMAFEKAKLTSKFFPTIAEIREISEGIVRNHPDNHIQTGDEAWSELVRRLISGKSLKEMNSIAYECAQRIGMQSLLYMKESENPVFRTRFVNLYDSLMERQRSRDIDNELMSFMPENKRVAFDNMLKKIGAKNALLMYPK